MTARGLFFLTPALAIGLAMGSASSAIAQPLPEDTLDRGKVLSSFSSEAIDATMKTVTGNHGAQVTDQGVEFVSAYAPNGLQFTVHYFQCAGQGAKECAALQLMTSWQVEADAAKLDALMAGSAPDNLFVNMGRLADGRPYMSRIVIAGDGISQANLATEIKLFLETATNFNAKVLELAAN